MKKVNQPRFNLDLPIKLVKLTKISDLPDAKHPKNMPDGFMVYGAFLNPPEKGKRFFVGYDFATSTVKEIVNENTFKTQNSLYRWEIFKKDAE